MKAPQWFLDEKAACLKEAFELAGLDPIDMESSEDAQKLSELVSEKCTHNVGSNFAKLVGAASKAIWYKFYLKYPEFDKYDHCIYNGKNKEIYAVESNEPQMPDLLRKMLS